MPKKSSTTLTKYGEYLYNEREIRFLLDGHSHDGKDSAYVNRSVPTTTGPSSSFGGPSSNVSQTTDNSGNNFTGTLVGTPGPTQVTSPWSGIGPFINALNFPGTGHSGVNCGAWDSGGVPAIHGTGSAAQFTLEARVQFTSLTGGGAVCGWFNVDQPPQLFGDPAGMNIFWTDDTGVTFNISGSIGSDLNPHVLAATYDGTTMRLFNDGVLIASQATTGIHAYNSGDNFWIGSDDQTEDITAIVDEVRWSNICRYTTNYTPVTSPFISDANTLALYHLDDGNLGVIPTIVSGGTIRGATVIIAASNASVNSKNGADFVCTGTNDGTAINNFLLSFFLGGVVPASIVFTEGTFNLDTSINIINNAPITISGEGWSTIFNVSSTCPDCLIFGGQATLKDFSIYIDPINEWLSGFLNCSQNSTYDLDHIYFFGGGGASQIMVGMKKNLNISNCVFNLAPVSNPIAFNPIWAISNNNGIGSLFNNGIVQINNNIFINCGLDLSSFINTSFNIITNNYFTGTPGGDTISAEFSNNIIISNNTFSNCFQQSELMTITSDWAKISNNIFNNCLRIIMENGLGGLFINNQCQNTIDSQLALYLASGSQMVQGNLFDGGTPRNTIYANSGQNIVINNRFGPQAYGLGPAIFDSGIGTLKLNLDGSANNWNYGV